MGVWFKSMFRFSLDKMKHIRYSDIIVELPGKVRY